MRLFSCEQEAKCLCELGYLRYGGEAAYAVELLQVGAAAAEDRRQICQLCTVVAIGEGTRSRRPVFVQVVR